MKKKKITSDEIELRKNPINEFTCCGKTMPHKDFMKHITDVHKLTKDQFKGTKQMVAHIDGDYWFSYKYQWKLESGLEFSQFVRMARADDDMMRY